MIGPLPTVSTPPRSTRSSANTTSSAAASDSTRIRLRFDNPTIATPMATQPTVTDFGVAT
jgi:hypothetical protein